MKGTVAVRTNNPRSRIYGIGNRAILSREWRSERACGLRFVRWFSHGFESAIWRSERAGSFAIRAIVIRTGGSSI